MVATTILAVVQADLQLIVRLQTLAELLGVKQAVARSADEAILYFRGVGVYRHRGRYPLPDLVLLDSTNPDAADLTVLSWLRESPEFKELPAAILCEEIEHQLHVLCALDPYSFLVNRTTLAEIPDILFRAVSFF
jgi:CheY-like chemotaxis protein